MTIDANRRYRPKVLELLFKGVTRSTHLEVARAIGGPILWLFDDAEPWHVVVTDGHVEAKPGRLDNAALTLRTTAAEWAKIAVGRADPRRSLLRRRLRVSGSLGAKAKLPRLFAY